MLVIVAGEAYFARHIYASLGFEIQECTLGLESGRQEVVELQIHKRINLA